MQTVEDRERDDGSQMAVSLSGHWRSLTEQMTGSPLDGSFAGDACSMLVARVVLQGQGSAGSAAG